MKRLILVMMCALLYVMPVNATELNEEVTSEAASVEEALEEITSEALSVEAEVEESTSEASSIEEPVEEHTDENADAEDVQTEESVEEVVETEESVAAEVTIPDVTGMTETEAIAALEAVVLPDGSTIEIIKEYKYSKDAAKDVVYKQTPSGVVSTQEAKQVNITISMGTDPNETIVDGITEPLNQSINSQYGIDWDSIPASYEYNWDNSENCWVNGVFIDDVKYITPEGTYNTNVRHKIQLYTDGTYVYTHIVFSRDYESAANGNWYNFFIDGQVASFQIETYNGIQLANNNLDPGTYQVVVRHADGSISYQEANDSSAYYTVFDSQVNAHLELKIPLSEMVEQNSNISIDSIGTIEFFSPNLMYNRISTSGASTFPFAMAAAALVLVPGSALIINKKRKTIKRDLHE